MRKTAVLAVIVVLGAIAAAPLPTHAAAGACTSAALSSNAAAMPVGNSNIFTATSTGCANPEYKFFLQPPGGSWTPQFAFGAANTFNWQTSHSTPQGVWGVGVWAREQGSTAPYEAWYIGTFTLLTDACTSTQLFINGNNPTFGVGQWTLAANTNCSSAQYRFWMLPPGGSWTILEDWQASSTFTFDTASRTPGTYLLGVWARNPLSGATYDSYGISSAVIGGGCEPAFESTMQNPAYDGTTVPMSAAIPPVACIGAPLYQFWLLAPGGWTVEKSYSSQGWWNWDTSSLGPGTYEVGLWVKESTSAAAYDGYYIGTVTLLPSTCGVASIASSPPSPQTPGGSVTFLAGASGECGGGGWHKWWVLAPGSTWKVVQDYAIYNQFYAPQYVWNTSGLAPGAYRIGVWLRSANPFVPPNQSPAYDSYAIVTFWLGT